MRIFKDVRFRGDLDTVEPLEYQAATKQDLFNNLHKHGDWVRWVGQDL